MLKSSEESMGEIREPWRGECDQAKKLRLKKHQHQHQQEQEEQNEENSNAYGENFRLTMLFIIGGKIS